MTPVLFLDDQSRHIGSTPRNRAEQIAITLLATLGRLRKINSKIALNTARPIAQHLITDNWTLQALLGGPAFKEEWDFVRALSDRSPFSQELEEGMSGEINAIECCTRPGQVQSNALAWATALDSATVSFNAHLDWSQSWVGTTYRTLDEAGNLVEAEGQVRNACLTVHADEHADWLRQLSIAEAPTAAQIWNDKGNLFPKLRFLPRTEKDLKTLEGSGVPFLQAIGALRSLASDANEWKRENPWPTFTTKASGEAEQRQELCWVHDDATNKEELFDWHTRFTGGVAGRIHFRVDAANKIIVVAYIGGKLVRKISG